MPRGVKRQTEDGSANDSVAKKNRVSDNLQKFEQMKKEAEENRRRVRDDYLREQEAAKANEGNQSDGDSRRDTISAPPPAARPPANRRKSTSSAEGKLILSLLPVHYLIIALFSKSNDLSLTLYYLFMSQ